MDQTVIVILLFGLERFCVAIRVLSASHCAVRDEHSCARCMMRPLFLPTDAGQRRCIILEGGIDGAGSVITRSPVYLRTLFLLSAAVAVARTVDDSSHCLPGRYHCCLPGVGAASTC